MAPAAEIGACPFASSAHARADRGETGAGDIFVSGAGGNTSSSGDVSPQCEKLPYIAAPRWALHVPLGKLHTERLVPADPELRQVVERILALRALAPPSHLAKSQGLLLPRGGRHTLSKTLRSALAQAAKRAGCAAHVTPHRLRHSFATEMLRLGVSLPALMQLLGHKDIRMTLRYVQVTQQDLQREFHQARGLF
jgi:site-specific recombinase XerD